MKISIEYTKKDKRVFNWLILGCILIGLMVVIGGITRLTQSGLSMVKWEPIMGTLPPMSQDAWNETFELYKQSPEFIHYNKHFTLSEFKSIFFWEYLHRLIARIIGLVFLIPCLVFWIKNHFNSKRKKQVIIIFIWGAFQGVLGWVMVKSGLVDKPHVDHYRLAAHLITAIGLLVYMYYVALGIKYEIISSSPSRNLRKLTGAFIVLLFVQIIYGAFVAGLKAGLMYNSFPKMGNKWIPSEFSSIISREGVVSFMESPGIVQFIHRMIAYIIVIFAIYMWFKSRKVKLSTISRLGVNALLSMVIIQVLLGIFTLLWMVPVSLGVLHQFGAIVLLLISFFLYFTLKKKHSLINL